MSTYRVFKLIASSNAGFSLTNDAREIVVHFVDNVDINNILQRLGNHGGTGLSLHFEHMTGNDLLPNLDVYLNLGNEQEHVEEKYVGAMGLYGLGESSTVSAQHDGAGQERIFEVTSVFRDRSKEHDWSGGQFILTLLPNMPLPAGTILNIGRVALYYYET